MRLSDPDARSFDDPLFLREADRELLAELEDPARQEAMRNSRSAQQYKVALEVAKRNMKALVSATRDAAAGMQLDRLGTLDLGNWADLVTLNANPLDDIFNTREIDSVWIGGNRVPARN